MNKFIKNRARKILSRPYLIPISALFSCRYSGIGCIIALHRVISNKDKVICEDLEITTDYLESVIKYFLDNNYEVISLDTVYDILMYKREVHKKFVVFTFDDGYIDNYTLAYPIFKKYNIPLTIYVTTSFPDKTANLWWYALKDLINDNNEVSFSYKGSDYHYDIKKQINKNAAYSKIKELILSENVLGSNKLMDSIFTKNNINLQDYCNKLTLSWSHIKELAKDSNVTIGAHTTNHYNLKMLDKDSVREEIIQSKNTLERFTGRKVEHFAFPFGSRQEVTNRELELVKDMGFKTVTTTRCGNIFLNHQQYTNSLPRISIRPYTETPYTQLYTNGFIPALVNNLKRIVTD